MNKHRIPSGDRIHSKVAMDLLVRDSLALKDSKDSLTSSEKVKGQANHLLVTYLMNLRRCLDKMGGQNSVARPRPRDKTSCSIWKLTLWTQLMGLKRLLLSQGLTLVQHVREPCPSQAHHHLFVEVAEVKDSKPSVRDPS